MKKFAFTLQSLYHLKQSLEKQERNTLAQLAARLARLEAEEASLVERRSLAGQQFAARVAAGMRAGETAAPTAYDRMLREQIDEARAIVRQARADVEQCRTRLLEAMREVHMLERLRERQYAQYLVELQAEQNAAIDDFVNFTVAAPRGEPSTGQEGAQ